MDKRKKGRNHSQRPLLLCDTLFYLYNVMNNNGNNNSEFQREKSMVILTFALYEISRCIML